MNKEQILQWAEQHDWPRVFVASDCIIQAGKPGWQEFMGIRFDVWCETLAFRIQQQERRWQQQNGVRA